MIASIKKACQIISCFTSDDPALGVGEIADWLDIRVSTLYDEGLLMRDC